MAANINKVVFTTAKEKEKKRERVRERETKIRQVFRKRMRSWGEKLGEMKRHLFFLLSL